ncbi:MAG: dynamin family protein [Nocardioidaceae bacterium]
MDALSAPADLIPVIVRLRQALVDNALPFDAPDADLGRAERDKLIRQLDDYVLPRLLQIEAPLLAVVGGSTGAGKSTLVNSVVGSHVTESGVLRPTTRSPVLVHHPDDARWFAADRLLPELDRTDAPAHDQGTLQLVATKKLPRGVAIIDAPDVDSVEERNRTLAAQLLDAADLWLFVTSAARYADQVPWGFLKSAAERGAAVAVVLDRTTPSAAREVSSHLARMLTARGLSASPLFTVVQSSLDEAGLLPPQTVAPIRAWLTSLASDSSAGSAVIQQTLDGTVASLGHRARVVSDALKTQERLAAELRERVVETYVESRARAIAACFDGSLLRGELLTRWQALVRSGELMRSVEDRVGRMRDRLTPARGSLHSAQQLTVALESQLAAFLVETAESAAERAALKVRSVEAGAALLDKSPDLGRAVSDVGAGLRASVRDWQGSVLALVRTESADRGATSRFLSYGVPGLTAALTVVVLDSRATDHAQSQASTGRRILGGVFGDATMERLVGSASGELAGLVTEASRQEEQRLLDVLDGHAVADGTGQLLLELSREVDDTRWVAVRHE